MAVLADLYDNRVEVEWLLAENLERNGGVGDVTGILRCE